MRRSRPDYAFIKDNNIRPAARSSREAPYMKGLGPRPAFLTADSTSWSLFRTQQEAPVRGPRPEQQWGQNAQGCLHESHVRDKSPNPGKYCNWENEPRQWRKAWVFLPLQVKDKAVRPVMYTNGMEAPMRDPIVRAYLPQWQFEKSWNVTDSKEGGAARAGSNASGTAKCTNVLSSRIVLQVLQWWRPERGSFLRATPEHVFIRDYFINPTIRKTRGKDPMGCPRPSHISISDISKSLERRGFEKKLQF